MKRVTRAFSLVEVLIVVVVLALTAALIVSVLSRNHAKADTVQCAASLHQIGTALQLYVADYDGVYPLAASPTVTSYTRPQQAECWQDALEAYTGKTFPFCPARTLPPIADSASQNIGRLCGYGLNTNLSGMVVPVPSQLTPLPSPERSLKTPALTVAVFDSRVGHIAGSGPDSDGAGSAPVGATRHQKGANYLFTDNHIKWLAPSELGKGTTGDSVHPGFGL